MPLKANADEAVGRDAEGRDGASCSRRTGGDVALVGGRDHWWPTVVEGQPDDPARCPCEPMDSEDLLFLLYSSGTTGKPKGIVHTTAGYLIGVATTHHYIFDIKPRPSTGAPPTSAGSPGTATSCTGRSANGTTSVLYEGVPDFPERDRWWEIIERYRVTVLYTAPTAIRTHMKWGPQYAGRHDLSSLRLLGSVGEPINPEAWMWYRKHIGGDRTPVVDTWWQTETGMIMITPLPGVTTLKPGSATRPFPGDRRRVFDEQGEPVRPGRRRLPRAHASRGPRCCAGSTRIDERYRRDLLVAATTACTSPATARASTRTATSGCSAASTTS